MTQTDAATVQRQRVLDVPQVRLHLGGSGPLDGSEHTDQRVDCPVEARGLPAQRADPLGRRRVLGEHSVEACLDTALRLETYVQDADRDGDSEVADLFRTAQADSRKGAELGKQLLRARLAS